MLTNRIMDGIDVNFEKARIEQAVEKSLYHIVNYDTSTVTDDPSVISKVWQEDFQAVFTAGLGGVPTQRQEDRGGVNKISVPTLSEEDMAKRFCQAILALGEQCKELRSGSTLTCTILHNTTLFTAQVGDSRSVVLVRTPDGGFISTRLTWSHRPTDLDEEKRVLATGGQITRVASEGVRLNGKIKVTRAFGDNFSIPELKKGLSFEPTITKYELPPNAEAYVILGTDGIMDALHDEELAMLFKQALNSVDQKEALPILAQTLRKLAYARNTKQLLGWRETQLDNIALLILPVNQSAISSQNIVYGFVADGHGGDETVNYIAAQLQVKLQAVLGQAMEATVAKESSYSHRFHSWWSSVRAPEKKIATENKTHKITSTGVS